MTAAAVSNVVPDERLLAFVRALVLPSGRRMGDARDSDPWIESDLVRPVLASDDSGLPRHRLCWLELIRGSGKTTLAAALAITEALRGPDRHVIAIASDLDQARLLAEAARALIRNTPKLAPVFKITQNELRATNGSLVRVMSADAPSFYGVGVGCKALRIFADEVGQWASPDLWHAALTTLPKLPDAQIVALTNAGIVGTWQEEARAVVAVSGYLHASPVVPSWIRAEDLAQLERSVPPAIFARYYGNIWVPAVGTFVDMQMWDACRVALPPLDKATQVVVGVDAAVVSDSFACVAVSRAPDRPDDAVGVRDVAIWRPDGQPLDFAVPWAWLAAFCAKSNVVQVAYDPYQLHDFMVRFQRENAVWCEPFSQMADRARADSDLFQLIRSGRLRHDGHAGLREHVANSGFKVAAGEDSRARLVKRGAGKIDAAVALSMAASECLRLNLN